MNPNFILRSGKHAGKTLGRVTDNDNNYLAWVQENRPEMLKGSNDEIKPVAQKEIKAKFKMEINMNFWDEGPAENSLPYIKKMEELKKKKDLEN